LVSCVYLIKDDGRAMFGLFVTGPQVEIDPDDFARVGNLSR